MINFLVAMILILSMMILACFWFLGTYRDERNAAQDETEDVKRSLTAIKRQRDQLAQALAEAKEQLKARPAKKRKKPTPPKAPQKGQLPTKNYIEVACYPFLQASDVYLPIRDVYRHYLTYCKQNSYEALSRYRFSCDLKELSFRCDRRYLDGKQCRVVWGIVPKL